VLVTCPRTLSFRKKTLFRTNRRSDCESNPGHLRGTQRRSALSHPLRPIVRMFEIFKFLVDFTYLFERIAAIVQNGICIQRNLAPCEKWPHLQCTANRIWKCSWPRGSFTRNRSWFKSSKSKDLHPSGNEKHLLPFHVLRRSDLIICIKELKIMQHDAPSFFFWLPW
jgi:hypothetical protein